MTDTRTETYARTEFQVQVHHGPKLSGGTFVDTREYDSAEEAVAVADTMRAVRPELTVKAVRVTRTTTITTATEELQ